MSNSNPNHPSAGLNRFIIAFFCITLLLAGCGGGGGGSSDAEADASTADDGNGTTDTSAEDEAARALAELGGRIFQDTDLSNPTGQSCATCHDSAAGFADPDSGEPVSEGAFAMTFGSRNTPTASYAAHIPEFTAGPPARGGQFLDGRAPTLEEQAKLPFLNPREMNMADKAAVVTALDMATYRDDFISVFGAGAFDSIDDAYDNMARAIAAFERTDAFSPFNSDFDRALLNQYTFTADEMNGLNLFNGKAGCSRCHSTRPADGRQVFSDFFYSNVGVPPNTDPTFTAANPGFIDNGLGDRLGSAFNGMFRTPTLRNVAVTAPYMHNGVFGNLNEVMEFYNNRPETPEVNDIATLENAMNAVGDIGNLELDADEIRQIIAFLQTLTDN